MVARSGCGEVSPAAVAARLDVRAALHKRIPAGAGLGGGSSDGARMLSGLNRLWSLGLDDAQLADVSSRYGSDLPFFFSGPSSLCRGRGEIVRPVARPKVRWATLVLPGIHMPTPAVYRKFDEMTLGRAADIAQPPPIELWAGLDAMALLSHLCNDLEKPACAMSEALRELMTRTTKLLNRPVRMSGSGSSLFTLYDTSAEAQTAAGQVVGSMSAWLPSLVALAVPLTPDFSDDLTDGL